MTKTGSVKVQVLGGGTTVREKQIRSVLRCLSRILSVSGASQNKRAKWRHGIANRSTLLQHGAERSARSYDGVRCAALEAFTFHTSAFAFCEEVGQSETRRKHDTDMNV